MKAFHLGVLLCHCVDISCIFIHLIELAINAYFIRLCGTSCPIWTKTLKVLVNVVIFRVLIVGYLYNCSFHTMPKFSKSSWRQEAFAVIQELYGVFSLYSFFFPFASLLTKDFQVGRKGRKFVTSSVKYPILFVHGYASNAGLWYPLLNYLTKFGVTRMYTITLSPLYLNIPSFAVQLANKVEQVLEETQSEKVILVCHSMGGLVARAFIKWKGGDSCVAKLLTLGSPHHGTEISKSILARVLYGDCVDDMIPRSDFLEALGPIEESNGQGEIPVVSIFSHHDPVITPQSSSYLEGKNVESFSFFGVGHLAMPFLKQVQTLILEHLENAA